MDNLNSQQNLLKAYNVSLKYLATRTRSIKEVRDNLHKKKFNTNIISEAILMLENEKLVDDHAFAAEFVAVREKIRPKSKFALRYELNKKGVPDSTIEKALTGINEYKSALAAIEPKLSSWLELDQNIMKKKMMNFLKNRGFNFEIFYATYKKVCNTYR